MQITNLDSSQNIASMNRIVKILFLGLIISLKSCGDHATEVITEEQSSIILESIDAEHSGIRFNNLIRENKRLHSFIWNFIYQGAGVAIGDINNDGLPDVYFCGNMVSDKLYLNKGDFQFEDISVSSGIQDKLWSTGVNFVDINDDGFLDVSSQLAEVLNIDTLVILAVWSIQPMIYVLDCVSVNVIENEISVVLCCCSENNYLVELTHVLKELDAPRSQLKFLLLSYEVHQGLIKIQNKCILLLAFFRWQKVFNLFEVCNMFSFQIIFVFSLL